MSNGLLPYIAREIYGTNQTGLGYLSASFAVGSLIGSILLSLVGGVRVARLMIGATRGMVRDAAGISRRCRPCRPAIACLLLAGFSQSLCMISIAVILMRTASEHFRGRVMGVRMLVIYSLPLGLLAAGSLIDLIGFAATANALCGRGSGADDGGRGALARGSVARPRAGECEVGNVRQALRFGIAVA